MAKLLKHKQSGLELNFPLKFWNGDNGDFYKFYLYTNNKGGSFRHPNLTFGGVEYGNIIHFPTQKRYAIVINSKQDNISRNGELSKPFTSSELFNFIKETLVENVDNTTNSERWNYSLSILSLSGAIKVESECIKNNLHELINKL